MDDLINISNYCDSMLVKYGERLSHCNAIYLKEDDVIEFRMKYHTESKISKSFQYQIESFNFLITDTEVLVNKASIDAINMEIEKRINNVKYASV